VGSGLGGDLGPAQHAGNLFHPFRPGQGLDPGVGLAVAGTLADQQLMVALGGDLGQVRDA
jgi:hypothetical protein